MDMDFRCSIRPAALMLGILLLCAVLVLVAGCASGSSQQNVQPTPVYTPKTTILIGSASVNPQVLVVGRGVTVTWINTDIGNHIVTSDTGTAESFTSPLLKTNNRYQFTFTTEGTYGYHCADNPSIKGTVIVTS